MKLKQRILVTLFASTILTFLLVSFFTLYFYSDSYELIYPNLFVLKKVSPSRTIFEKLKRLELYKESKGKKKRKKKFDNITYANSDHAAEVVLTENEYAELLANNEILNERTKEISLSKEYGNFRTTVKPMDRYFQECVKGDGVNAASNERETFHDLIRHLPSDGKSSPLHLKYPSPERFTMQKIHEIVTHKNLTSMELFHLGISQLDLYHEDDPLIKDILQNMAKQEIVHIVEKEGGTQFKLILTFYDGNQAMMKPMRFDRHKETAPDHFYFVDYERHNSEIAAFHLDRILGFRRCPPVVGRLLNITTEVYSLAEDDLLKTFFISPAQNICFHGHCSYYCDTSHAICGHPDMLESSLAAFLPPDQLSGRKAWKSPWKRTYHKRRKAQWETNEEYCQLVRNDPLYNNTKRLAGLIDTAILDFLIGNMDRHHYETFKLFGNDSFILHLDHGRGFGKAGHDEISILAPLYQCCFISTRTFQRLLQLQHGPRKLSTLMRCSLYEDPLNPIILDPHLEALDRRLKIILETLRECFHNHKARDVLFNDIEETS